MTNDIESAPPTQTDLLQEKLERVTSLDVDQDLVRASNLGDRSFKASRALFEEVIEYCDELASFDWPALADPLVKRVADQVENVVTAFEQVRAYTIELSEGDRDTRAQQVRAAYESLQSEAVPLLGYLSWHSVDVTTMRQELNRVLEEATSEANTAREQIEALKGEAERVVATIQEAAAEAGVATQADTFRRAALRYEQSAKNWLYITVGVGVLTGFAAVLAVTLWVRNGDVSDAAVLQVLLAKAVLLAVGLFFTTSAARVYRSSSHLAAVNRHREDALRTFRAFVEGAGDDTDVKNKILLEAAHAAFGQTPTGLLGGNESGGVLEILDGVGGDLIRRR